MQVHPYGMASQGIGPDHPIDLTVNVERLSEPLKAQAIAAISEDTLLCYVALNGDRWVSRAQLAAAVGFGHKLYDPSDPWFVPPTAVLKIAYLAETITDEIAAASDYQRFVLRIARRAADYLAALQTAMPPRPFTLHVHRTAGHTRPLRQLIERGALAVHPSHCGWWIKSDEVQAIAPDDEIDNPNSAWFVGPHDRADRDAVDALVEAHRSNWPEIYPALDQAPSKIPVSL